MEITEIKFELTQMEHRLTEMEEKIDSINTKLTQVVDAILGNPLTKTGGFVNNINSIEERLKTVEQKQQGFEEFKKRLIWTIGIIVTLGLLFEYLISVYKSVK